MLSPSDAVIKQIAESASNDQAQPSEFSTAWISGPMHEQFWRALAHAPPHIAIWR